MADNKIYFDRLGNLSSSSAIPHPKGVFASPRSRLLDAFQPGAGGQRITQMTGGGRLYTIPYAGLTGAMAARLQAFADGLEGPGPFVLLDPGQRNMLPPNIAAATSVTNSIDGINTGGFDVEGVSDDFNRAAVASGWGTAPTGQAWSHIVPANHAVSGGVATQTQGSVGAFRTALIETGSSDFDITVTVWVDVATPTGANMGHWVCARLSDISNYMIARLEPNTAGNVALTLLYRSAGSLGPALGTGIVTVGTGHAANEKWTIHFTGTGTSFTASAWRTDTESEPTTPDLSATDSTITTGTQVGLLSRLETSNTNTLPVTMYWDDLTIVPKGTLTSSTAYTDAGPRVLAHTATAVSNAVVRPVWPSSTFRHGVPVVSGRAVTLSCYIRGGGTDAVSTWAPRLLWKGTDGSIVSTTTTGSGATATSSGAWAQIYATGTPPAGAAYVDFQIEYVSGASTGGITYFRRFLLNEGSTPDTSWTPGTGVWPVKVVAFEENWLGLFQDFRVDPALSLAEDTT